MLRLVPGVSKEVVATIVQCFAEAEEYRSRIPADPASRLLRMGYCFGIFDRDQCVAAVWGDERISLVCLSAWRGRVLTRRLVKEFYSFFFGRYEVARIEDLGYSNLWKRLGFREVNGALEARIGDIKWLRLRSTDRITLPQKVL